MAIYRCTRKAMYKDPNCPGHENIDERQGYYVSATNRAGAIYVMRKRFPEDAGSFTVTFWTKDS